MSEQSKGDRLLDILTEMDEDDGNMCGVLNFHEDGPVDGRYTVTIDGRRATLYLDPLPVKQDAAA